MQGVDVQDLDERAHQWLAGDMVDYGLGYVADRQNRLIARDVRIKGNLAVDEQRTEADLVRIVLERCLEVFDEDIRIACFNSGAEPPHFVILGLDPRMSTGTNSRYECE